jgi:hypothetical protein
VGLNKSQIQPTNLDNAQYQISFEKSFVGAEMKHVELHAGGQTEAETEK